MKLAIAILVLGSVAWAQPIPTHLRHGVRSCEKRNWPVEDPICHGYSLTMAHWFYEEHPHYFEDVSSSKPSCNDCKLPAWLPPPKATSVDVLYDTSHPNLNSPNCYDQPDGSTFCPFEKSSDQKTELGIVVTDKPVHVASLKCGKYQHVDTVIDCSEAKNGHVLCPFNDAPTKQTCADDIHPLTEREWQEIMARLKKLEKGK